MQNQATLDKPEPQSTQRVGCSLQRFVSLTELKAVPDGTYVQVLPGGNVLLNPTPTEYKIIELYAAEMRRINPSEPAICQAG